MQGIQQKSRKTARPILPAQIPKRGGGKNGPSGYQIRTPVRRPVGCIRFVAGHTTHTVIQRLPATAVTFGTVVFRNIVR